MLVFSRKNNESIVIGDNIVVTIVDIRGDKVRLGIDAPLEVPVHRREVFDAIRRNQAPPQGQCALLDPPPPSSPPASSAPQDPRQPEVMPDLSPSIENQP